MIAQLFRRRPSWRTGLVHIWCASCGRDLDWAQPKFVASHPEPRCWPCQLAASQEPPQEPLKATAEVIWPTPAVIRPEPAIVRATAEVLRVDPLTIEKPQPFNPAFEAAVAEAEVIER